MERRSFIHNSSVAAMATFFGLHDIPAASSIKTNNVNAGARILNLDLVTTSPVAELKKFYTSVLEFPLVSEQKDRVTIKAGETTMSFTRTDPQGAAPFYHFAFNIPQNKILKAREWQLKRTALSASPAHMVDTGYPADVRHFSNWNAHSVFFWDPAGNLVEYIARHDLDNSADGDFISKDILCASEIAFIVDNTETIADEVKADFNLTQYRGGDANFRAIGDENGLLLMIRKGRIWESHTNISRTPATIKTSVTIKGSKENKWTTKNYPFEIIAKS